LPFVQPDICPTWYLSNLTFVQPDTCPAWLVIRKNFGSDKCPAGQMSVVHISDWTLEGMTNVVWTYVGHTFVSRTFVGRTKFASPKVELSRFSLRIMSVLWSLITLSCFGKNKNFKFNYRQTWIIEVSFICYKGTVEFVVRKCHRLTKSKIEAAYCDHFERQHILNGIN
jgi:hypothetical protein